MTEDRKDMETRTESNRRHAAACEPFTLQTYLHLCREGKTWQQAKRELHLQLLAFRFPRSWLGLQQQIVGRVVSFLQNRVFTSVLCRYLVFGVKEWDSGMSEASIQLVSTASARERAGEDRGREVYAEPCENRSCLGVGPRNGIDCS